MTSTEVTQADPAQALVASLRGERFREQLEAALPRGVDVARFTQIAITAINQNPQLAMADNRSVFLALLRAAQDGLLPDGREAALLVFRNKRLGIDEAQYTPMIGGYRKIAAEHGWQIDTQIVCEHDTFDYTLGENPTVEHKPPTLGQERGKMIGAYAVSTNEDGRKIVEVMSWQMIQRARNVSRATGAGTPWETWPERMAEKTVGKRAFVKLPLSTSDDRVRRLMADDEDPAAANPPAAVGPALPAAAEGASPTTPAPDAGEAADGAAPDAASSRERKAQLTKLREIYEELRQARDKPPDLVIGDEDSSETVGFESGEWQAYGTRWIEHTYGVDSTDKLDVGQLRELIAHLDSLTIPF